jgi:tRNA pseudouridine55 synthase
MSQVPPRFSAVKVHGRPLYWWARRGTPVTAKARTVEIFAIELVDLGSCCVRCRIDCSAGTYIRGLAETIAQRLGTVGHVSELMRLSVGSWNLHHASGIDWLKTASVDEIYTALHPVEGLPT